MSTFCVHVCVYECVWERERETVCCEGFQQDAEVWNSLRNANILRHLPTNQVPQSLQTPPPSSTSAPAARRHTMHNTPPHPTPPHPGSSSSSTTGVTACGPGTCGADTACLPNSKGDRWGEVASTVGWKYWGNWRERKGGRKQPLGLFTLYHLSHKPFATQRAGALPPHRIRAPHPRAWMEVCSGCVGGLLYVKHKSVSARSHGLLCILLLCFCTRISPGPAQTSAAPAGQSG